MTTRTLCKFPGCSTTIEGDPKAGYCRSCEDKVSDWAKGSPRMRVFQCSVDKARAHIGITFSSLSASFEDEYKDVQYGEWPPRGCTWLTEDAEGKAKVWKTVS